MLPEELAEELRLGSAAQLRGELAEDFTAHCKESLLKSLTDAIARLDAHDQNDVPSNIEDASCLLVSVDPEVLLLALELRAAYRWYCRLRGTGDASIYKHLKEFSYGWPGDDEPLDLTACIHGCATPEATRLASSLYFEFYQDGELQVIRVGMEELQSGDCLLLFNRLVREFRVPEDLRFALLTRIRFAKAFPSAADRHQYIKIMLHCLNAPGAFRYSQKQVREVAASRDIPDGLRAAAMYASRLCNRELEPFAIQERDAMIHAFLCGEQGREGYSSEFIKALFYDSWTHPLRLLVQARKHRRKLPLTANMFKLLSLEDVLAWLEDELDEEKSTISRFDEHASLGQKQATVRGLILSLRFHDLREELTKEQSLLRDRYLEKILDDSNLLERRSSAMGMRVQLSLNGWKIVEACMEHFSSVMRPGACSKMAKLVKRAMASIPERSLKAVMGDENGLFAVYLLQTGGYKFLEKLPSSAIGSRLWIKGPVDKSVYESMAKLAERLGRSASSSEEHFEKLVKFIRWMLRCNYLDQVHTGSLKALVTTGAVGRLLEAARRRCESSTSSGSLTDCFCVMEIFVKHRRKWEQLTRDVRKMLSQFLGTVLHILNHCNEEQLAQVESYADRIIRSLCPPAADTFMLESNESRGFETADMASSTIIIATGKPSAVTISPPPLLELIDLLLKLYEHRLDITIWRRYGRDERESAFVSLLEHLESEDPIVVDAAARLVNRLAMEDNAAGDAVKALASRLLELIFAKGMADKLVAVLGELFQRYNDSRNALASKRSDEENKTAVAWFLSYIRVIDPSDRRSVMEMLKFGDALTENNKLAMELATSTEFASLFRRLLELYHEQSSSLIVPRVFFSMVWHLLEDHDMIYNRMAGAIRESLMARASSPPCEIGEFLKSHSTLACREPIVFIEAIRGTCQVTNHADGRRDIALQERDRQQGGGLVLTRHFRDVFTVMLDVLLPDLQLSGVRLLKEICDRLGDATVELVLGHRPSGLGRALEREYSSSVVQGFLDVVERHNKGFVDEVAARAFSCRDAAELLKCCGCLRLTDASGADRIVRALCGLDLDHPSAARVVNGFVDALRCFSTGKRLPDFTEEPEPEPDEGFEVFCIQQDLTLPTSVVPAATFFETPNDGNGAGEVMGEDYALIGEDDETDEEETERSEEDERPRVNWRVDHDDLEKLVKLLWLSKCNAGSLCFLLENHADHNRLARVLVDMVSKPGALRAFGSEGNGHWHRNSVAGVPPYVAQRVIEILHGLVTRHGFSFLACINEDDAVSFMSLMLKNTAPVEKLLKITRGLSETSIVKLCSLSADTQSAGDVFASVIAENPALYPVICSTILSKSTQLISTMMEKLCAGDHTSDTAVLHLVQTFDRVAAEDDHAAREQLKLALDPLWIHAANDHRSSRPLLQALFLAHTFSAEPAEWALQLAHELVQKTTRNMDLILPLLWKWPRVFSVDVRIKLALLRSKFEREPRRTLGLHVNRDDVLLDSYTQFAKYPVEELRKSEVSVKFRGEPVAGGGVKREWFQLLSQALKDKELLLLSAHGDCYQPNPLSSTRPDHLSYFRFFGHLVAEAIIEGVRLDIRFTPSFLKHILGQPVSYKDMEPEVSKNLTWLLENEVNESMGLAFCIDKICLSASEDQVFDLFPGGRDILVNEENKRDYVDRAVKYQLTDCIKPQIDAFLGGFYQLVPKDVIRIFDEHVLEFLISGSPEIDVAELKETATIDEECDVVKWFWEVVEGFDEEDKARLLKFITGSAKITQPRIGIYVNDDPEVINLPTASTCYKSIYFPRYKSRDQLEQKLLLAIREGCEGFHAPEE